MGIPYIPETRNYWLIRTKGGRFYEEFRKRNEIGINWNEISPDYINKLDEQEIKLLIARHYPDSKKKGRIANQLRIFEQVIKAEDIVVITGPASNKFTIGKVLDNSSYVIERSLTEEENNRKYCPYTKRKKVKWIKELQKWDVELPMFKLLQHAQHAISEANNYKDNIESMIHDLYIRDDYAQINIRVKKEGSIPPKAFFSVGHSLIKLIEEFSAYTGHDTEITSTEINVNSPGKIKLSGKIIGITALGLILVSLTGGQFTVDFPNFIGGGGFEITMNSLIGEVDDFMNSRQQRKQSDQILHQYIDELEIKAPEELIQLLNSN